MPARSAGTLQGCQTVLRLAIGPQRLAAGRQNATRGAAFSMASATTLPHRRHARSCRARSAPACRAARQSVPAAGRRSRHAKRGADGTGHQFRCRQRRQGDEPYAVGIGRGGRAGDGHRDSGLADAAGPTMVSRRRRPSCAVNRAIVSARPTMLTRGTGKLLLFAAPTAADAGGAALLAPHGRDKGVAASGLFAMKRRRRGRRRAPCAAPRYAPAVTLPRPVVVGQARAMICIATVSPAASTRTVRMSSARPPSGSVLPLSRRSRCPGISWNDPKA